MPSFRASADSVLQVAPAGLASGGLSLEQLRHFSAKGWVVQENAFTLAECARFRAALDRLREREYCPGPHTHNAAGPKINMDNMVNSGEPVFLEFCTHPRVLPVLKQIIGAPPTYECCHAMIDLPHPDRHDPDAVVKLLDPETYSWHRGIRPKWGIVDSDLGADLKSTTFMNNIC
jgi:hypothetical protein